MIYPLRAHISSVWCTIRVYFINFNSSNVSKTYTAGGIGGYLWRHFNVTKKTEEADIRKQHHLRNFFNATTNHLWKSETIYMFNKFFYQQIFKLLACTPCVSVRFVVKGEIFEIEWISGIGWVFDMEGIALVFVWFANIWEIMVLSARSVGVPRVKLNISKKYCNLFWSRCPMYQWVFLYPLSTLYIARIHFSSTCCEICQNYANDNNNM